VSQPSSPDNPDAVLRTNQILNGALLAGPLIFLGIILFLQSSNPAGLIGPARFENLWTPMALLALILAACNLLLAWFLPDRIVAAQRQRLASSGWKPPAGQAPAAVPATEAGQLMAVWTTGRMLRLVLIEGAALFAAIVYLLEGSIAMLGLCLVLLALIAWQFPTAATRDAWLDEQTEKLGQERAG
jgi:hypothetical protein